MSPMTTGIDSPPGLARKRATIASEASIPSTAIPGRPAVALPGLSRSPAPGPAHHRIAQRGIRRRAPGPSRRGARHRPQPSGRRRTRDHQTLPCRLPKQIAGVAATHFRPTDTQPRCTNLLRRARWLAGSPSPSAIRSTRDRGLQLIRCRPQLPLVASRRVSEMPVTEMLEIVAYDQRWPAQAAAELQDLAGPLGTLVVYADQRSSAARQHGPWQSRRRR